ncbi:MAG: hypothetical protein J6T37_06370 [Bacteroidales bacterium]|jgi:hypothetical protein|nr:hypothetical protein [Bacteroidales bacterium]MBO7529481.1 hypothetical protein [Bacteroidales bacterium]
MVEKLTKYCKYLLVILMLLNVLFLIIGIANGKESVGTFMIFAYCMLGLAVVAILFAPIYGIVINPKSVKTMGLVAAIVAVIALIAWLFAKGSTLPAEYLESMNVSTGTEAFVDFFMVFTYIVVGATIASVIYSAVSKLINK